MARKKRSAKKMEMIPNKVEFHYIKSSQHRVVYCEGVIGSITPHGKIFASLYNERVPVPKMATHTISADGVVDGTPPETQGLTGIVRELEVGVCLDRDAAEQVRDWLTMQINKYDKSVRKIEK